MAIAAFDTVRSHCRTAFRDELKTRFSDDALDVLIAEAQREYCLAAVPLRGEFALVSTGEEVQSLPADFIRIEEAVDMAGRHFPCVSWRYLNNLYPDFRRQRGTPYGICPDFDSFGQFRLCPRPEAGLAVGTLFYRRLPASDALEVADTEPIEEHALFQMCLFSGDAEAETHYSRFMYLVNRLASGASRMSLRPRASRGGRGF